MSIDLFILAAIALAGIVGSVLVVAREGDGGEDEKID